MIKIYVGTLFVWSHFCGGGRPEKRNKNEKKKRKKENQENFLVISILNRILATFFIISCVRIFEITCHINVEENY